MKQLLLVVVLAVTSQLALASESYIVKLDPGTNPILFAIQNNVTIKNLLPSEGLYVVRDNETRRGTVQALSALRRQTGVQYAQKNHTLTWRSNTLKPNDKNFHQQWDWLKDDKTFGIDAVSAWAVYGTGGLDPVGNEIVVAVVDGGFELNHPDLFKNAWVNKDEIPGNDIDDDNNGYVDDVHGWDVDEDTGHIQVDYHGTHVAGTIGAQGNNHIHGAGVNWNVKIMYLSAGFKLAETDETLAAYGYILKQKQLWLQSGGKKGANVVAINSSFGIDRADCNSGEYAAWNDIFDKLGAAGILSIAATANANWNIDQVGDVPTGCDSEFMVGVTNSEVNGERTKNAGYGKNYVEIAAPGTNILSTFPDDGFGTNSGTSMATPHVTGAVAYLHSVASPSLNAYYLSNPKEAALVFKDILMKTVTPRSSMQSQVGAGGILDLFSASQEAANYERALPLITTAE